MFLTTSAVYAASTAGAGAVLKPLLQSAENTRKQRPSASMSAGFRILPASSKLPAIATRVMNIMQLVWKVFSQSATGRKLRLPNQVALDGWSGQDDFCHCEEAACAPPCGAIFNSDTQS